MRTRHRRSLALRDAVIFLRRRLRLSGSVNLGGRRLVRCDEVPPERRLLVHQGKDSLVSVCMPADVSDRNHGPTSYDTSGVADGPDLPLLPSEVNALHRGIETGEDVTVLTARDHQAVAHVRDVFVVPYTARRSFGIASRNRRSEFVGQRQKPRLENICCDCQAISYGYTPNRKTGPPPTLLGCVGVGPLVVRTTRPGHPPFQTARAAEGEDEELLRDTVNSLIKQGHKNVALNLAAVTGVDDAGLGPVIRAYATVSRQGGRLKLLNFTRLDLRRKHLSESIIRGTWSMRLLFFSSMLSLT
jgi:hypothetical protein